MTQEKVYDCRAFVVSYLNAQTYQNAHPDLASYYGDLYKALCQCTGVQIETAPDRPQESDEEINPYILHGTLLRTAEIYRRRSTPFDGIYEAPREYVQFCKPYAQQIGKLNSELGRALFDFMVDLLLALYPELQTMHVSAQDLARVGFTRTEAPDPLEYF